MRGLTAAVAELREQGLQRCARCREVKPLDVEHYHRASRRFYADGLPRFDAYCRECRRKQSREIYRNHAERVRADQRDRYAHKVADPVRREAERARQKAYREDVKADPVRAEAQRARRRRWQRDRRAYLNVDRALSDLHRRFVAMVAVALREELVRRERAAREERERRRAYQLAWRAERRARFLAGEFDDVEPVFRVNGHGEPPELVRLPAGPLAAWVASLPVSVERLAADAQIHPRALRRYTTGESVTVAIEIVDALTTRLDVCLHEIYDPGRWPSLYEVAPAV